MVRILTVCSCYRRQVSNITKTSLRGMCLEGAGQDCVAIPCTVVHVYMNTLYLSCPVITTCLTFCKAVLLYHVYCKPKLCVGNISNFNMQFTEHRGVCCKQRDQLMILQRLHGKICLYSQNTKRHSTLSNCRYL